MLYVMLFYFTYIHIISSVCLCYVNIISETQPRTSKEDIIRQTQEKRDTTLRATPKPKTPTEFIQEQDFKAQQIKNPFLKGAARTGLGAASSIAGLVEFGYDFTVDPFIQGVKQRDLTAPARTVINKGSQIVTGVVNLVTSPAAQKQMGERIQANPSGAVGALAADFALTGGASIFASRFTKAGRLASATASGLDDVSLFGVGRKTRTTQKLASQTDEIVNIGRSPYNYFDNTPIKPSRPSTNPQLVGFERSLGVKGTYKSGATTQITVRPNKSVRQFIRTPKDETFIIEQGPTGNARVIPSRGKPFTLDRLQGLETVQTPLFRTGVRNPLFSNTGTDLLETSQRTSANQLRQGSLIGEIRTENFLTTRTVSQPLAVTETELGFLEMGNRRRIITSNVRGARVENQLLQPARFGESTFRPSIESQLGDLTPSGFQSEFTNIPRPRQQIVEERIIRGRLTQPKTTRSRSRLTSVLLGPIMPSSGALSSTVGRLDEISDIQKLTKVSPTRLGPTEDIVSLPRLKQRGRIRISRNQKLRLFATPNVSNFLSSSLNLGTSLQPISLTGSSSALRSNTKLLQQTTNISRVRNTFTSDIVQPLDLPPAIPSLKGLGVAANIPAPFNLPKIPESAPRGTRRRKGKRRSKKGRTGSITSLLLTQEERNLFKGSNELDFSSGLGVRF